MQSLTNNTINIHQYIPVRKVDRYSSGGLNQNSQYKQLLYTVFNVFIGSIYFFNVVVTLEYPALSH